MIKLVSLLKEIGEGVDPYKWTGPHEVSGRVEYYFTTEDNDEYVVDFNPSNDDKYSVWGLTFYTTSATSDRFGRVVNRGRLFKVMSTVMDIMKDFMESGKYPVYIISFSGAEKSGTITNQRDLLYQTYIKKNIDNFPDWTYKTYGSGRIRLMKKGLE
jgi:hypothetical protein